MAEAHELAICLLCRGEPALVRVDAETEAIVAANAPGWPRGARLCASCARRFAEARAYLRSHGAGLPPILPTPLRLGAVERFRGRGVTIAFLDAGFYAHPDLVTPKDRILAYVDVTDPRARRADLQRADESSWHGMMTSVVACGNGALSGGLYRGIASEASLVLVRCGSVRRVKHDDIRRGLDWVIRNRKRHGIRIVNVSVGGDYERSYLLDGLSQSVERATREGLLVCAAVGNLGQQPRHPVLPPASAPSALSVGGLDDKNRLAVAGYDIYHGSYGPTLDGLQKPELLAPGIWVAAPILPGAGPDGNAISASYKHVDGTSFAAPIVASVAAQMLEANPRLLAQELKCALIATARRIPHVAVDRQGWGVVDPHAAVAEAMRARQRRARSKD